MNQLDQTLTPEKHKAIINNLCIDFDYHELVAVGGIIGFALVWDGTDAVIWAKKDSGSFPPYKGVVAIILSWFISPVLSGAAAAFIFFIVRTLVLRQRNAYALSFWTLPPFVLITTFINMYFVFTKVRSLSLSLQPSTHHDLIALPFAAAASIKRCGHLSGAMFCGLILSGP